MSETTQTEIDTGYETNNTRIKTSEWDVEAYADDGKHAMCWMLRRVSDELIEQQAVACEAGLREEHGNRETFDVDADTSTEEFAREVSKSDPELAIELAREHFDD